MLAELPRDAAARAVSRSRGVRVAASARRGDATDAADWSYGRLKRVLAEVRARGWADEDGEVTTGLASVGAAVVDHLGWPAAAIAVTFPDDAASELRERAVERRARGGGDAVAAHPRHPLSRCRVALLDRPRGREPAARSIRVTNGSTQYVMIGVSTRVVASTRSQIGSSPQPGTGVDEVARTAGSPGRSRARSSRPASSAAVRAAGRRRRAPDAAASATGTDPVAGSSNQPSMPVRRRLRSERTNPSPIDSHQLRSGDRSQASRVSSFANR